MEATAYLSWHSTVVEDSSWMPDRRVQASCPRSGEIDVCQADFSRSADEPGQAPVSEDGMSLGQVRCSIQSRAHAVSRDRDGRVPLGVRSPRRSSRDSQTQYSRSRSTSSEAAPLPSLTCLPVHSNCQRSRGTPSICRDDCARFSVHAATQDSLDQHSFSGEAVLALTNPFNLTRCIGCLRLDLQRKAEGCGLRLQAPLHVACLRPGFNE